MLSGHDVLQFTAMPHMLSGQANIVQVIEDPRANHLHRDAWARVVQDAQSSDPRSHRAKQRPSVALGCSLLEGAQAGRRHGWTIPGQVRRAACCLTKMHFCIPLQAIEY